LGIEGVSQQSLQAARCHENSREKQQRSSTKACRVPLHAGLRMHARLAHPVGQTHCSAPLIAMLNLLIVAVQSQELM
jgi:hypothetical protein